MILQTINNRLVRALCAIAYGLQSKFMVFYLTVEDIVQQLEVSKHIESLYKNTISAIMMGGEQVDLTNYVKHNNFKHCAGADYVPVYNQYNFDPTPIRKALGIERNSTDADWEEWIYKLSLCVLKHSPSIWYQTCYMLAVEHVPLAEIYLTNRFYLYGIK